MFPYRCLTDPSPQEVCGAHGLSAWEQRCRSPSASPPLLPCPKHQDLPQPPAVTRSRVSLPPSSFLLEINPALEAPHSPTAAPRALSPTQGSEMAAAAPSGAPRA